MPLDPTRLALFTGAALLLLLTPGPAVLYIVTRSASQGVRAGLVSVAAVELGNAVHAVVAALGLSAVLASSALAFTAVKLLGAGYLLWLGLRKLLLRPGDEAPEPPPRALRAVFRDGLVVAVLNPKTALFFLAFLPQFVDPRRGAASLQMLLLGAVFVAMGTVSDGAYALLAGTAGRWLRGHPRAVRGERWVTGAVYLGLGAVAALAAAPGSAPAAD